MIKRHELVEMITNDLSDSTIDGVLMTKTEVFNGGLLIEFFQMHEDGKLTSDKYKINVELIVK